VLCSVAIALAPRMPGEPSQLGSKAHHRGNLEESLLFLFESVPLWWDPIRILPHFLADTQAPRILVCYGWALWLLFAGLW